MITNRPTRINMTQVIPVIGYYDAAYNNNSINGYFIFREHIDFS